MKHLERAAWATAMVAGMGGQYVMADKVTVELQGHEVQMTAEESTTLSDFLKKKWDAVDRVTFAQCELSEDGGYCNLDGRTVVDEAAVPTNATVVLD